MNLIYILMLLNLHLAMGQSGCPLIARIMALLSSQSKILELGSRRTSSRIYSINSPKPPNPERMANAEQD